jgi:hypothetical protein
MQLILAALASAVSTFGNLLARACTWIGRSLASVVTNLVTQPVGFAMRLEAVVAVLLFCAFILAIAYHFLALLFSWII